MTVSAKTTIASPKNSVAAIRLRRIFLRMLRKATAPPYFPVFCRAIQACISRTES